MAQSWKVTFSGEDCKMVKIASVRCCPPGSEPALKDDGEVQYESRGAEETVGKTLCYCVGSEEAKSAVIVVPDIYGMEVPNGGRIRLICDQLADAGYFVVLPKMLTNADGTDGWPAGKDMGDDMGNLMAWLVNYTWEDHVRPQMFDDVLPFLEGKNFAKIGMIGFCWGAWVNFHTSAGTERVVCCVNCHPSVRLEGAFGTGSDEVKLAETVQCPQLLMPAGNDPDNIKPGGDVTKVLEAKPFGEHCRVREFPEMQHGWVPRGDTTKPEIKRDVAEAIQLAIDYFAEHLG